MKRYCIILFLISFLISCNKKFKADFTTDEAAYFAGSTIYLGNSSENSKSCKWIMPDGRVSTNKFETYDLPISLKNTTLKFQLTAYSDKGNKSETVTKWISVFTAQGRIVFWKDATCNCDTVNVIISNQMKRIITNTTIAPICGDPNTATFDLEIGNYQYSATDGNKFWNGSAVITNGPCQFIKLN